MSTTAQIKSMRLHIGIFGRRNVGKSSLLNALTNQSISIVSSTAGTTTDPVEKPMELLPLGPVLFIDTAGIDDEGDLGKMRIEKTRGIFNRTEIAIVVATGETWTSFEEELLTEFDKRKIPCIIVFNKSDISSPSELVIANLKEKAIPLLAVSSLTGEGIPALKSLLIKSAPEDFINPPVILSDLVPPGEICILVVPIDKEAPKGRLILPQVQAIRDLLDGDSICMVVKERELKRAIDNLKHKPTLVVTDSQAFLKVAADTPPDIPMTSFSILLSRFKGDLTTQAIGTLAIDNLKSGDKVLISEACTHHPIGEDIGRVKIPRWLTQYIGGTLNFTTVSGHDFPPDLSSYKLVVHCGSCMHNRREMLSRLLVCHASNVPITNYGLAIAYSLGIFDRALSPFPAVIEAVRSKRNG